MPAKPQTQRAPSPSIRESGGPSKTRGNINPLLTRPECERSQELIPEPSRTRTVSLVHQSDVIKPDPVAYIIFIILDRE